MNLLCEAFELSCDSSVSRDLRHGATRINGGRNGLKIIRDLEVDCATDEVHEIFLVEAALLLGASICDQSYVLLLVAEPLHQREMLFQMAECRQIRHGHRNDQIREVERTNGEIR